MANKRIHQLTTVSGNWYDYYSLVDKSGLSEAKKVSIRSLKNNVFYAEEHGLRTDGTASSNAAAINATIAEASSSNGIVMLPPGEFVIEPGVIVLPDPNSGQNDIVPVFMGHGNDVTILKIESPATGNLLTIEGNWKIVGMTFKGYETYDANVCQGIGAYVSQMYEGSGFFDCRFKVLKYGIKSAEYEEYGSGSAMQGTRTHNCYFGGISEAGVWLANTMNANHFIDCVFANGFPGNVGTHGGYGIRMGPTTSNIIIDRCQFLTHKNALRIVGTTGVGILNSYFETTSSSSGPYIIADGVDSLNPRQTLTNGSTSAGQKIVTVDDTSEFWGGQYVAYDLVGGYQERNRIATVDSGTQVTLVNNIGSGGIANDTPFYGIEFVTNLTIERCVNSFQYDSGPAHHVFLQLRDARNSALLNHWSTAYGKGLVDLTDDAGDPITTVTGLVMANNRNDHANTKMFVSDEIPNGALMLRYDISDVDSGGIPYVHLPKNLYTIPDSSGGHSFALYADGTLMIYADASYVDAQVGFRVGTGTKIVKHFTQSVSYDWGDVAANSTEDSTDITITGIGNSTELTLTPIGVPASGVVFQIMYKTTNTAVIRCANVTTGAVTVGSRSFLIGVRTHS